MRRDEVRTIRAQPTDPRPTGPCHFVAPGGPYHGRMPSEESLPPRWTDPALLDHLDRVRGPWHAHARRIVRAVVANYLNHPPSPVVEIGAGGGQLRDWLPEHLLRVTTHTEPSEPYVVALRERFPDANVLRADAANLPFAAGSLSAVLALCVLDTLPELSAVRDEFARVLRPGGVVVHFLDLATSPDALFAELIAGGELLLPNFARDPALLDVLTDRQRALLPPADEFDDVLAVPWEAFARFVGMLESSRHPIAADLGPYARLSEPGRLDPERLARGFIAVRGEPALALKVNRALLGVTLAARGFGREWPLRAVSSREHLRERLRATFGPEHGFAVEFAGPVSSRESVLPDTLPSGVRMLLRHTGRTVSRLEIHEPPGTPVEVLEGSAPTFPNGAAVRATTVEVFVARRLPSGRPG